MNAHIKLLAERAGMVKILDEHASEYGNGTIENTPYPELARFALLIVSECAGIYDTIDNGNLHQGTDNYLEALYKTFRS